MRITTGHLNSAYLLMLVPLVSVALLVATTYLRRDSYTRRFTGRRLLWEMWGSTLLIGAILLGGFYWYLFWRPFYAMTIPTQSTITLHYALPARSVTLPANSIVDTTHQSELLPSLFRPLRRPQTVVLTTGDGRSYVSAPVAAEDFDVMWALLTNHLP